MTNVYRVIRPHRIRINPRTVGSPGVNQKRSHLRIEAGNAAISAGWVFIVDIRALGLTQSRAPDEEPPTELFGRARLPLGSHRPNSSVGPVVQSTGFGRAPLLRVPLRPIVSTAADRSTRGP